METLLDVKEALEILKISRATMWRLMRKKKLNYIKIGSSVRFEEEQIRSFIEAGRREGIQEEPK